MEEKVDTIEQEISLIVSEVNNFVDSLKMAILSLNVFEEEDKENLIKKLDSLKK